MIRAKEKMIPNTNKRRRVDSASGAEDASSFYKRLGLDILTPSSTSGLSQQTELNTKNNVQQTYRTACQSSNPTHRPDNGVRQWVQSHQRDSHQPNSVRTSYSQYTGAESVVSSLSQNVHTGHPVGGHQSDQRHGHDSNCAHPSNYGHWQQSNHANGQQSNHANGHHLNHAHGYPSYGHQPNQSYWHHGHQSTHSNEYQVHRVQTKPEFVNDGAFRRSRQDPLQIDDGSQPIFDRPVRKQPQVKPIDKYAPPDFLTIMYHPTPTLEDLGLTSYLDSPPSSPRAVSPARESEQSVTSGDSKSEHTNQIVDTSCKQTDAKATTSYNQTDTKTVGSRQTDTFLPWNLIKITIPDEEVKPAVHLDGSNVVDPRLLFGRRSRGQLAKREGGVCDPRHGYRSQLPEKERRVCDPRIQIGVQPLVQESNSVCDPRLGLSTAHQSRQSQSSALTVPTDSERGGPVFSMVETERPKKQSTVAEVCDPRVGLSALQSRTHQSLESQSSSLTLSNDTKRKGTEPNTADRPKKKLCVWSTVAEQYVTESRQSDNQEARRDAAYRRFSNDGRLYMRQQTYDAERHQTNIRSQTQPTREESYDEMLAGQKARQIGRQYLKPGVQSLEHTDSVNFTLSTVSDNKVPETSEPTVDRDVFGGMSPFSCWNLTNPEDPRFS